MSLYMFRCPLWKLKFPKQVSQNMSLDRIYSVNDLGVLLDLKLKFDSHITSTVNKAMSVLGFIKRWSKDQIIIYLPCPS